MLNLDPPTVISRIIILMIAFTVHEFSHAWVANAFGDDTPRMNGRLTLNPFVHLDVMGTLMLIFAGFGWAKPVPINPYAIKRNASSGVMWVSLAGPFSNLGMAILGAIPLRLNLVHYTQPIAWIFPSLYEFFFEFVLINLALLLFNLIPLAPLDGEKVLDYFLPPSWLSVFDNIRPYSPIILLALVFLGPLVGIDIIGWIMGPPLRAMMSLLTGVPL